MSMSISQYQPTIYSKIKETISIRTEIRDEIYKKQIIEKSLINTLLEQIQSIVMPLGINILTKAFTQQNEKKKKDRATWEFVKDDIVDRFFNNNKKEVKFEKLVSCGLNTYAYEFIIKFHGITFGVQYPCPKNIINEDDLFHSDYGKYILTYQEDKLVWDRLESSYYEEDIAMAIKKFIAKQESKINDTKNL